MRSLLGGIHGLIIQVRNEARSREEEILKDRNTMSVFMAEACDLKEIHGRTFDGEEIYNLLVKKEGPIKWAKARLIRGLGGLQRHLIAYEKSGEISFRTVHSTARYGSSLSERIER